MYTCAVSTSSGYLTIHSWCMHPSLSQMTMLPSASSVGVHLPSQIGSTTAGLVERYVLGIICLHRCICAANMVAMHVLIQQAVCNACSRGRAVVTYMGNPTRVCKECLESKPGSKCMGITHSSTSVVSSGIGLVDVLGFWIHYNL